MTRVDAHHASRIDRSFVRSALFVRSIDRSLDRIESIRIESNRIDASRSRSIARSIVSRVFARVRSRSFASARRARSSTRDPPVPDRRPSHSFPFIHACLAIDSRAPLRLFGEFRLVHEILARIRAEIFLDAVSRAHRRVPSRDEDDECRAIDRDRSTARSRRGDGTFTDTFDMF